ncbi:MAG TPA: hypothetical protein VFS20_21535 [Longimicrobium sp.]|nr:hypothetical protein [Longimicrobium sp.]
MRKKSTLLRAAGSLVLVLSAAIPAAVAERSRHVASPTGHVARSAGILPSPGVSAVTAAEGAAAPRATARPASAAAATGPVRVEPNGGVAYLARPQVFTIWNTGTTAATFTLAATCQGAATSCAVSPGTVTIGPSASAQATVTFGIGGTGGVQLTATSSAGAASGYIDVQPLPSPYLSHPRRHLCLSVALHLHHQRLRAKLELSLPGAGP